MPHCARNSERPPRSPWKSLFEQHFGSLRVNGVIQDGDPAQVIVDYAHKQKVDLIMMPTHGYGVFRRFLIGSVTGKVLHDALCPIWTSVHKTRAIRVAAGQYQNILCAVDSGSGAVPLIRWAGWMARRNHATFKLVHVIPALDEISRNRGEVELRRYLSSRAQSKFSALMDQAGFRPELLLRGGNIPARLTETARQQHADLLIIGRGHLRKNLGLLRTHSLAIVRESPCVVVSV
jgi:nucleotide-binding universal stress UspA family protein